MRTINYGKASLLALVATAALTACQYDPYAHLYTTEKPADADVVGTYLLTSQTMSPDPLPAGGGPPTIVLRADHTFEVHNFPTWRETSPAVYKADGYASISGTWKIDSVGSIGDGSGKLKTHWGLILEPSPQKEAIFGLIHNKAPYILHLGYGDPDGGFMMQFEQKK